MDNIVLLWSNPPSSCVNCKTFLSKKGGTDSPWIVYQPIDTEKAQIWFVACLDMTGRLPRQLTKLTDYWVRDSTVMHSIVMEKYSTYASVGKKYKSNILWYRCLKAMSACWEQLCRIPYLSITGSVLVLGGHPFVVLLFFPHNFPIIH